MVWLRSVLSLAPLFVTLAYMSGGNAHSAAYASGGEQCQCSSDQAPLIIFIGADRDVGKWGKLPEVTAKFCRCGYSAVYFDPWKQLHDDELLASWIRHAVKCRGRRIMLVGWSYGTVVGLKALRIVAREGIRVDTFIELDCFNLNRHMGKCVHPSNADRVVVIQSRMNRVAQGYRCPIVHRLDSCRHLGSPTHPHTTRVLFSEARRLQSSAASAMPSTTTTTTNSPESLNPADSTRDTLSAQ